MRRAEPAWPRRAGGLRRGLIYGLIATIALVFLVRTFFADVYSVRSSSMVPTLFPGDRVLVRYSRPAPRRFDLVVFRDPDGGAVVKRIAGLPGESIRIVDGDLVVDGAKLDWAASRPRVLLFDGQRHDPTKALTFQPVQAWTFDEGALPRRLTLDARGFSEPALANWHKQLRDGWIDVDGERRHGNLRVHDTGFRLRVEPQTLGPEAQLVARLVERIDRYEVRLGQRLTVERHRTDTDQRETLLDESFDLAAHLPLELHLETLDDTLHLALAPAAAPPRDHRFPLPPDLPDGSGGPRLAFGARDAQLTFTLLGVTRDLHWTDNGDFAVDAPLQLGLDEVFLLGDNSPASADSRTYGPVRLDQLVGQPLAITRPYARARWLE